MSRPPEETPAARPAPAGDPLVASVLGEYFEPEAGRIVFPPKQAKGKKYHRVIYLTPWRGRAARRLGRIARSLG
jgi:hypothetical protein